MDHHNEGLQITLDNVTYSYKQILNSSVVARTEFEKNILTFCKAWLTGEERFTSITSGSTGAPKTIILAREQMLKSARTIGEVLGFKAGYTTLLGLDSQHIAGKMMLVRSMVYGMHIHAVSPSANPLKNIPQDICIDVAAFVPYQLSHILNSKNINQLNNMRCILVGGGPINTSLKKKISEISCAVYATYGMTETASAIALQKLNGPNKEKYFHVLPGVHIYQDNNGCLVIEADYITDKIVTRDLVHKEGPDRFQWLGRQDNLINSGGIKVIPEQLEQSIQGAFNQLQLFNNFFVTGLADEQLGQRICLIIEGKTLDSSVERALIKKMKATLDPYAVPKEVRFVHGFVVTPSKKIDRAKTTLLIN